MESKALGTVQEAFEPERLSSQVKGKQTRVFSPLSNFRSQAHLAKVHTKPPVPKAALATLRSQKHGLIYTGDKGKDALKKQQKPES